MQGPGTTESSGKALPTEVKLGRRLEDEGRESHSSPVTAGQTKMPSVRASNVPEGGGWREKGSKEAREEGGK